jgi:hypothetical protein
MGLFSKKEDTRYIKEFDTALSNINLIAGEFRQVHFDSIELFDKNFKKEKSADDLQKERVLFENHLSLLQKLKFQTDILVDESLKIVRNETALTEKDRQEMRRIFEPKEKTGIKVSGKK